VIDVNELDLSKQQVQMISIDAGTQNDVNPLKLHQFRIRVVFSTILLRIAVACFNRHLEGFECAVKRFHFTYRHR
jgi:hypothetical protein